MKNSEQTDSQPTDFFCVAKAIPPCYTRNLEQCDYCKWKEKEDEELRSDGSN